MKTLYIDCGMGAAGDMLTAALLELLPDREAFLNKLNSLGIPDVQYTAEPTVKCGITGTHMHVLVHGEEECVDHHDHDHEHHHHDHEHEHHHDHNHEHGHEHHHDHDHEYEHEHHHHDHEHHHHTGMHEIEEIVHGLPVSEQVRGDILAVYHLIAEAESHAHNKPVDQIHFHEVGSMDAIADVTAVCLLMEELGVEKVVASPVHVGSGTVRCAHGVLPVPAPATAYILKDVPMYGGKIRGELCTPTGAALLKHFVTEFGDMPVMKADRIGYGMGKKDFEVVNCVRTILGETAEAEQTVTELACNLDDMTPEEIGFAMDLFLAEGALDAYTIPVGMKKCRPGTILVVMCREEQKEKMLRLIFRHTTTLGVREYVSRRYTLNRRMEVLETPYGEVRKKISTGYGTEKSKLEYEDLVAIAREHRVSLREILEQLKEK